MAAASPFSAAWLNRTTTASMSLRLMTASCRIDGDPRVRAALPVVKAPGSGDPPGGLRPDAVLRSGNATRVSGVLAEALCCPESSGEGVRRNSRCVVAERASYPVIGVAQLVLGDPRSAVVGGEGEIGADHHGA